MSTQTLPYTEGSNVCSQSDVHNSGVQSASSNVDAPPERAQQQPDGRKKIFVGGLSYQTTDDGFKNYFLKYGEIDDSVVMRNKLTGESRGFGFVTFRTQEAVNAAVNSKDTLLDGRHLDIKLAIPREVMDQQEKENQDRELAVKKVFVRGLAEKTSQEEFERYFEQFGTITDAIIMVDRETQKPRGFGFVTFEDPATLDKVIGINHTICGKPVTCEKAKPREVKIVAPGHIAHPAMFRGPFQPEFVRAADFAYHPVDRAFAYSATPTIVVMDKGEIHSEPYSTELAYAPTYGVYQLSGAPQGYAISHQMTAHPAHGGLVRSDVHRRRTERYHPYRR